MTRSQPELAGWETGGVFRCCFDALPMNDDEQPIAGEPGQTVTCPHCKREAFTYHADTNLWKVNDEQ